MIEINNVYKKFDENIIFKNFSLKINDNEITTIFLVFFILPAHPIYI